MASLDPLTSEEMAVVDSTYEAIPPFSEWPQHIPRPEIWEDHVAELRYLRAGNPSPDVLDQAVSTAMRAAAFDTGAIEGLYSTDRGLTMTVATQAASWQADLDAREPDARTYFEAQLEAYDLVMDVVAEARPITEVWIRQLHEVLTGPQDTYVVQTPVGPQDRPLPRGEYKVDPNHVKLGDGTIHPYAPVEATAPEMARLVGEIVSPIFAEAHPVIQASYVHYCLVAIHPFADGNGRVARAVASTYLYRGASIPLMILVDQRNPYFMSLEAADRGDRGVFVRFVADAAQSAIGMVIESIRTALAPRPADAIKALGSLLTPKGGLTHHEIDAIGSRLQDEVSSFLEEALDGMDLPAGVSKNLGPVSQGGPVPPGFRSVLRGGKEHSAVVFASSPPAKAVTALVVQVAVSTSDDDAQSFVIFDQFVDVGDQADKIVLGLHDVYPELSGSAQFRIRRYLERLIGRALSRLADEVRAQLANSGYRDTNDA
jgi:Fic family protein